MAIEIKEPILTSILHELLQSSNPSTIQIKPILQSNVNKLLDRGAYNPTHRANLTLNAILEIGFGNNSSTQSWLVR